ncbi:hypothetical protein ACFLZN_02540 [Nanoarchaeota archaeon]
MSFLNKIYFAIPLILAIIILGLSVPFINQHVPSYPLLVFIAILLMAIWNSSYLIWQLVLFFQGQPTLNVYWFLSLVLGVLIWYWALPGFIWVAIAFHVVLLVIAIVGLLLNK